jgi:hypothetical protein
MASTSNTPKDVALAKRNAKKNAIAELTEILEEKFASLGDDAAKIEAMKLTDLVQTTTPTIHHEATVVDDATALEISDMREQIESMQTNMRKKDELITGLKEQFERELEYYKDMVVETENEIVKLKETQAENSTSKPNPRIVIDLTDDDDRNTVQEQKYSLTNDEEEEQAPHRKPINLIDEVDEDEVDEDADVQEVQEVNAQKRMRLSDVFA